MTYSANDKSVDSGAPVECYKFISPFGTFRYTSNSEEVTVDGELYTPLPIVRTSIETGSIVDTIMTMDFVMPADSQVALLYCFKTSPENLRVEARRVHRGDDFATEFKVEWVGYGLDTSVSDEWATVRTGSIIQSKLKGNAGSVYYQRTCNHVLYDDFCKVNPVAFTLNATITKVQNQLVTVDNDGAGNGELSVGEIVNVRTGERRSIYDNQNNVVTISFPFIDVLVGDAVQLIFGCNRLRLGHCKQRFDNVVNYGGHDFIPILNPFTDLKPDTIITTTVKRRLGRPVPPGWNVSTS